MTAARFRADHLYTASGWMSPGYLEVDGAGTLRTVRAERPRDWPEKTLSRLAGFVVPGSINVHSHAHLRALAGRTERASAPGVADNLWTWRAQMYACTEMIEPEDLQAIAAQAYVEMLEAGYTTVGEFHYVHHDRTGRPYADPAEMSKRVLAAAGEAGIAITLLPVLYATGGVGKPPSPSQRRFLHPDPDRYLSLVDTLANGARGDPLVHVGIAPHSLRAVDPDRLSRVLGATTETLRDTPIHIHVAERKEEVQECVERLGAAPVEWLVANVGLDTRWTLVHATHCSDRERRAIAASGAVVGLCPATEANLGDGIFPIPRFVAEGGSWGIGTDMNHAISLIEELRILELGQRLRHQRRNILADPGSEATAHTGRRLLDLAWTGGARSVGHPVGSIESGKRADLVVLDAQSPSLMEHGPETILDAWIFSATANPVRDVMVAGRWVVHDGAHRHRDRVLRRFRKAIRRIWAEA